MISGMSGRWGRAAASAAATAAIMVTVAACSSSPSTVSGQPATSTAGQPASTSAAVSTPATSGPATGTPTHTVVTIPPPSTPLRTATVTAGGTVYAIDIWAQKSDSDCAAHAHGGPVVSYLQAHPCHGLTRQLATTTVNGKPVGFNTSALSFTGTAPGVYTTAGKFRTLVLAPDTGSVNDLLAEGYRLPAGPAALPEHEAFAAFGEDASVTVYDAWYLSGSTPDNDPALEKMLQSIYLQY